MDMRRGLFIFLALLMENRLLNPKHHCQRYSIKRVHPTVFTFPGTAFWRQFGGKLSGKFLSDHFCHSVLCPFCIAKKENSQLFSR